MKQEFVILPPKLYLDYEQLVVELDLLKKYNCKHIKCDGHGGYLLNYMGLGEYIYKNQVNTYCTNEAFSAHAGIWLCGKKKYIKKDAKIHVHACRNKKTGEIIVDKDSRIWFNNINTVLNFDDEEIEMYTLGWWLTYNGDELIKRGIAEELI